MSLTLSAKMIILSALSLFGLSNAHSEVVDSSAVGFTVRDTMVVAATPDKVYHDLAAEVGKWWSSDHTFSGNSRNLSIEDKAGGCFCEKLENGGSVRHLTVVFAEPGKYLRMIGGLGPLQAMAVIGSLTWSLAQAQKGTRVELTYTVGGYTPGGLQHLAPIVDRVLLEQFQRLKRYVETGAPEQPRGDNSR